MAEDTPGNFVQRHRLRTVRQRPSADCDESKKTVIPWPTSQRNETADEPIANVQIAITDRSYAEELRRLLEDDNKHRACIVDRPNPTTDGVVVIDETTLRRIGNLEGSDAARYMVLRNESSDPDELWQTGIRYLIPVEYPPKIVRAVILGMELQLKSPPG